MANIREESYYPEIMDYIKRQIESNFLAAKNPLKVYCKTGELKNGLSEIIKENHIKVDSIINFCNQAPTLSLDIFALITDGFVCQLLVLEIKRLNAVGLQQLSQLIGYCIVSHARYGLLINVDGGESSRLSELIRADTDLLTIKRIMSHGKQIMHHLGVMEWDSITQNLTYTGCGKIGSLAKLCDSLCDDFIQSTGMK